MSNSTRRLNRRKSTEEENALHDEMDAAFFRSGAARNDAVYLHNALAVLIKHDMDADVRETLTSRMNEFFEKSEAEHMRYTELSEKYYALRERNDALAKAASK